jgi:hypothetical protein
MMFLPISTISKLKLPPYKNYELEIGQLAVNEWKEKQ